MIRRLAVLIGTTAAVWVLAALPAKYWIGPEALVTSGVAALLCLVPTSATLLWAGWALDRAPEQQLAMVLGGTSVRMFGVLAGAWALQRWVPYFQEQTGYWGWILVFYLLTLALEMALILTGRSAVDERSKPAA